LPSITVADALSDERLGEDAPALATTVRSVEIDSLGDDFPIATPSRQSRSVATVVRSVEH
jgi:hypothetical protein